jgi:CelD/BcsL family acetyltransferase involved in cellulose biosynthesis
VSTTSVHWELTVPSSLDELLESKSSKLRKDTRYDERRLTKEFGDRMTVDVFREPADLERLFRQISEVSATTYQHGLGVAFGDRALDRALTELAAERGWFRAFVLSIDGVPRAFWHGVAHRGRFNLGTPGYDPAYGRLRIGNYLLLRLLDDVCRDPSVEEFDFGFGDAFYKQRLGDRSKVEEDVLIYAPSLRGARVNVTRTAVLKAAGLARQFAERAPALHGLKRRWRSRLSAGKPR